MLNYVQRAILASAFTMALALTDRADAMMVSNPALAAVAATNFAQPEQVRGFSCNLADSLPASKHLPFPCVQPLSLQIMSL